MIYFRAIEFKDPKTYQKLHIICNLCLFCKKKIQEYHAIWCRANRGTNRLSNSPTTYLHVVCVSHEKVCVCTSVTV